MLCKVDLAPLSTAHALHTYKHHQATYEEFYATRPSLCWHHLVVAVQAAAISHSRTQEVYEYAAGMLHF
jgi:hypothetical protein